MNPVRPPTIALWVALLLGPAMTLPAADFQVSTPDAQFAFLINGTNANPTLTLARGHTYTFEVDTTANFHPFRIGASVFGAVPPGVSGENVTSGTVTFAVPLDATDCVYYCGFHGFKGDIVMTNLPAQPPPVVRILNLVVSSNLSLKFTGTNALTYFPEFSTNLAGTNWYGLTVQTNAVLNGTNDVICGLPSGSNLSNVFIRIRGQ